MVILIIIILIKLIEIIPKDNLKVYFVDLGQVEATLIITPQNKKILIDGGGSESYNIRKKYINSVYFIKKNK